MSRHSLLFALAICVVMLIGCDSDYYKLDHRDNPYDPETPGGRRIASIESLTPGDIGESPSWSHDGRKVAYYHLYERSILIMEVGSGKPPDILPHTSEEHIWEGEKVRWSPKESKLAYIHGPLRDISVRHCTETDSSDIAQLTEGGSCTSLVWSPDGKWIAYVQEAVLKIVEVSDPKNRIELGGNELNKRIEFSKVCDWSSDDGRQQIMALSAGEFQVQVIDIDCCPPVFVANGIQPLPVPKSRVSTYAVWSGDSSKVLYITRNYGREELWIMEPDGGQAAAILMESTTLEEDTFLFRVDSEFEEDLNEGFISVDLWNEFSDSRIYLSDDTTIQSQSAEWQIIDTEGGQTYTVKKEPEGLGIYSRSALNARCMYSLSWSKQDENAVLFVGSHTLSSIDAGIFLMRMAPK